jgi:YcxB-like protein
VNDNGQVIRATFSETEEYLVEAAQRSPERKKLQRKNCLVGLTGATIASVIVAWIESRKPDGIWWLGIPIGGFVAAFLIYQNSLSAMRRQIRTNARKRNEPVPLTTMEFRSEGFTKAELNGRSSFHPWSSIPKVLVRSDGLMIYLFQNAFIWLPRTAFASDQDHLVLQARIAAKVRSVERSED